MLALTVPAASIPFQFLRLEAAAMFRRPIQRANDDPILNPSVTRINRLRRIRQLRG